MIIVLCSKSGGGKDSLSKEIAKLGYKFVISTTSRPMRDNESEGDPYYFVDGDRFRNLIATNKLIEYRTYNTTYNGNPAVWFYGVEKSEIKDGENYVVVLDIYGLKEFKRHFKDRVISFYIDVDDDEREARAIKRGSFCKQEWDRRLKADEWDFRDEELNEIDYMVRNDDFNECLYNIRKLIEREEANYGR